MRTTPSACRSKPHRQRANVVLPAPLLPITPTMAPAGTRTSDTRTPRAPFGYENDSLSISSPHAADTPASRASNLTGASVRSPIFSTSAVGSARTSAAGRSHTMRPASMNTTRSTTSMR